MKVCLYRLSLCKFPSAVNISSQFSTQTFLFVGIRSTGRGLSTGLKMLLSLYSYFFLFVGTGPREEVCLQVCLRPEDAAGLLGRGTQPPGHRLRREEAAERAGKLETPGGALHKTDRTADTNCANHGLASGAELHAAG